MLRIVVLFVKLTNSDWLDMKKITPLKIRAEELEQHIALNKQLAKSEAIYKRFQTTDVIQFINNTKDTDLIDLFHRASKNIKKYQLSNTAILSESREFKTISSEDYEADEVDRINFHRQLLQELAWEFAFESDSPQKEVLDKICKDFIKANDNNNYTKQQISSAISDINLLKKNARPIDLRTSANSEISSNQMVALSITGENNNCGYATLAHLMLEHIKWVRKNLSLLRTNTFLRNGIINYFSLFDKKINKEEELLKLIDEEIDYLDEVFESKENIDEFQKNTGFIRFILVKKLLEALENPDDHQYLNFAIKSESLLLDKADTKKHLPKWIQELDDNELKIILTDSFNSIQDNSKLTPNQRQVILDVLDNGTMNITMLQAVGLHIGLPISIFDKEGLLTSSKYSALLGKTNVTDLEEIPDYYVNNVGNHWVPLLKARDIANRNAFKDDIKLASNKDYLVQFYNTLQILSKNPIAANFYDVELKTNIININEFQHIVKSINLIEKENSRSTWEVQTKNENSISLKKDTSRVEYFTKTGILRFSSIANKKETYHQDIYNFARLALNTNKQSSKPGTAIIRTEDTNKALDLAKMMLAAGCKVKIADEVMANHKDNKELQALLSNKAKSSLSL